MNSTERPRGGELVVVGALATALMIFAVVQGAAMERALFSQVLYTVRVTMVLLTVALGLYILPPRFPSQPRLWAAFWTFAFVSYAVHVYYSFGKYFHASVSEFFGAQGGVVAGINVVLTVWLTLDVVLLWALASTPKWVSIQRAAVHAALFLTFFISTVPLHAVDNKQPFVIVLGAIMGAVTLVTLAIRLWTARRT